MRQSASWFPVLRHSPLRVVVCLCPLAWASCATGGAPRLLAFPDERVRPASSVHAIHEYGVAAASVIAVATRDLGFGPFPIAFQFCANAAAFEATLLEAGYDRALARDTAATMQAVGGYRRVLLNEAALAGQPWPERVATLAHELGHSLQYEWGGGQRGTSDQWLREGFAEWLSLQVVDRLHGVPMPTARGLYEAFLRRRTPSPALAPRLAEMVTFRQWVTLGKRRNSAHYAQAFLTVDFLIARHGLPAVTDYFQRFARSADRESNFRGAFGEDRAAFEAAAAGRIWPHRRR